MQSELERKVSSHFVSQGPRAHPFCGFANFGVLQSGPELSEITLNASWFWQKGGVEPRYSATYPEEWVDLSKEFSNNQKFAASQFDLWVFRNLTSAERADLIHTINNKAGFRAIFAIHHLMEWQEIIDDFNLRGLFFQKKAFISFLPPSDPLDPFMKPQEVLNILEFLPKEIPILIPNFIHSNQNEFYRTLKRESYSAELKVQRPVLIKTAGTFKGPSSQSFLLALEALAGFLWDGKIHRLNLALKYLVSFCVYWLTIENIWPLLKTAILFIYRSPGKICGFVFRFIFQLSISQSTRLIHKIKFKTKKLYWYLKFQVSKEGRYHLRQHAYIFLKYRIPSFFRHILSPLKDLFKLGIPHFFRHKVLRFFRHSIPHFFRSSYNTVVNYFMYDLAWYRFFNFRHYIHGFLRFRLVSIFHQRVVHPLCWLGRVLSYPFKKIYWFLKYQYETRIQVRIPKQ